MRNSLKWRVTGSILVVLLVGFSWLVEVARGSIEESMEVVLEQDLTGRLYGLVANAEFNMNKNNLEIKGRVGDPVFNRPGSGYSAFLMNEQGDISWLSASSNRSEYRFHLPEKLGVVAWVEASSHYYVVLSVEWSSGDSVSGPWTFVVRGDKALMLGPINAFMEKLYVGLFYMGAGIIFVLIVLMVWQWRPVDRLERELLALESNEKSSIQSKYPRELDRLVKRLNAYIAHSHHQTESTRHYLENLAHHLKTPLAVLRSCSLSRQIDHDLIDGQVDRMDGAIKVAVQKAQAANRPLIVKPLVVRSIVERMSVVIQRAHSDVVAIIDNDVDRHLTWMIEEGDAFELFGNLMDNALKYGATHLHIHSSCDSGVVYIDDDGPGIALSQRRAVLERGARLDEKTEGEGIGLAIVKTMLNAYHGHVSLEESPIGGLRVSVSLPFERIQ